MTLDCLLFINDLVSHPAQQIRKIIKKINLHNNPKGCIYELHTIQIKELRDNGLLKPIQSSILSSFPAPMMPQCSSKAKE